MDQWSRVTTACSFAEVDAAQSTDRGRNHLLSSPPPPPHPAFGPCQGATDNCYSMCLNLATTQMTGL